MATRTVDLGRVIGPAGPQGPAGAAGASGPRGRGSVRLVVGTSTAGWTAADCDYLCDGSADQVEINAAIQALPAGGGEVVLLDGTYYINDYKGQTAGVILSRDNVTLRGSGPATRLTCNRLFDTVEVSAKGCTVRDLYAYSMRATALSGTGNDLSVLNTVLECADDGYYALSLDATGGRVIGNMCTGYFGDIHLLGSGHIVVGNRVSHAVGTGNVTNCVVANNLTVPWSEG